MRRVQLRGGARRPYARRTLGWGSAGAMSGPPQRNNRRCGRLAANQAWRPRAPHSGRWALIVALARVGPVPGGEELLVDLARADGDPEMPGEPDALPVP